MTTSKRKSEALTKVEFTALKQFAKGFRTGVECAEALGISRVVLDRILIVGSGSPDTVTKIKAALNKQTLEEGEVAAGK
jgi:hypothetical protein